MAKVKQAIIDVEEEVLDIVMSRTHYNTNIERMETITLPEVQTILFKKYFHKADTGYFLDETVVKNAYNKAVYEKENEEEFYEYGC
jgi:hypothetical protein